MHPTVKAARIAGAVYLTMVFTGPFSLIYVPNKLIVRGDATATAANVVAHETFFRFGILGDLVGHVIFICLGIALYKLLSDVNKTWARLMVGFVLVSAGVGFLNTLNNIAALILFHGGEFLTVFDKAQLDALGMLFVRLHSQGNLINELFWGLWLFPFGLARFPIRISTSLPRRLADDQLFCLYCLESYRVVLPALLQRRLYLVATGLVWRIGHNALAVDQRSEGAIRHDRST